MNLPPTSDEQESTSAPASVFTAIERWSDRHPYASFPGKVIFLSIIFLLTLAVLPLVLLVAPIYNRLVGAQAESQPTWTMIGFVVFLLPTMLLIAPDAIQVIQRWLS